MNRDILIQKVKQNKRFINNEDLLDTIVDLSFERLSGIVESIRDEEAVNSYVDKVVSKSVMDVLKQENRYNVKSVDKLQNVDYKIFSYDNSSYKCPLTPVSKLKQIYTMFKKSDENNGTVFLNVLDLRYEKKQSVEELSRSLELSLDEVVKILFDMSEYSNKAVKI